MTDDREHDTGGSTPYGFDWGPMSVCRATLLPEGRRVVTIETPFVSWQVYVSATGRSVRVYDMKNRKELT